MTTYSATIRQNESRLPRLAVSFDVQRKIHCGNTLTAKEAVTIVLFGLMAGGSPTSSGGLEIILNPPARTNRSHEDVIIVPREVDDPENLCPPMTLREMAAAYDAMAEQFGEVDDADFPPIEW